MHEKDVTILDSKIVLRISYKTHKFPHIANVIDNEKKNVYASGCLSPVAAADNTAPIHFSIPKFLDLFMNFWSKY